MVGPGSYEHDKNFKKLATNHSGYNFGNDKRLKSDENNVPGPGNYNAELVKSRKSMKIGEKLKDS